MWLLGLAVVAGLVAAAATRRWGGRRRDRPTLPRPAATRPAATRTATPSPRPAATRTAAPLPSPLSLALLAAGGVIGIAGQHWPATSGLRLMEAGLALALAGALVGAWGHAGAGWPGLVLIAVGLAANLTVITSNAGMPVRGLPPGLPASAHHHGLSRADHLAVLADGLALGSERASPGDVLIAAGSAIAAYCAAVGSPGRRLRRRPPAAPPAAAPPAAVLPVAPPAGPPAAGPPAAGPPAAAPPATVLPVAPPAGPPAAGPPCGTRPRASRR
jgi:hypothetical protein